MQLRHIAAGYTIIGSIVAASLVTIVVHGSRDYSRLAALRSAAAELSTEIGQLRAVTQDLAAHGLERAAQQFTAHHRQVGLLMGRFADASERSERGAFEDMRAVHARIDKVFAHANAVLAPASDVDERLKRSMLFGRLVIDTQALADHARILETSVERKIVASWATFTQVLSAALGGLFLMLLSAVSILWLKVLRPLAKFEQALHQVRQGVSKLQLSTAVSSHDEFGDLAREFDRMAAEIERRRSESIAANQTLESMNRQLELRVEQRTQELAQHADALERSNVELQRFAYVASHDLQTPLRSIAGFMQLVQRATAGKLDTDADGWMRRVVDNTHRMQALIRDLLEYARVDARARPFVAVPLAAVFDSVIDLLDASIRDAQAAVTRSELPTVMGDPSQLTQVLQNLVANAITYHGDQPPSVHVSAERNGDGHTICVSDNGIGIDPAQHEHIFDIFHRLHTQQAYPGTGLGLAVCRRVVSRHGGRIWVESRPGEGSRFNFTLPLEQAHEQSTGP